MSNKYDIKSYGPLKAVTVEPGQVDPTYSLKLVGRGAPGYGYAFAENTLRHLANFANINEPAGQHVHGQLWYDSGKKTLKICEVPGLPAGTDPVANPAIPTVWSALMGGGLLAPAPDKADYIVQVTPDGKGYHLSSFATLPAKHEVHTVGSASLRFKAIHSKEFIGVATSAQFADVAERYEASETMEPGDVVELGGSKEIKKTSDAFSTEVLGVVSTNPAFKMNSDAGDDSTHPYVALVGRVPVKVIGTVVKNQRLVSSTIPGVAIAANLQEITRDIQIIGRALENKTSQGIGLVEVVVGAR